MSKTGRGRLVLGLWDSHMAGEMNFVAFPVLAHSLGFLDPWSRQGHTRSVTVLGVWSLELCPSHVELLATARYVRDGRGFLGKKGTITPHAARWFS